MHSDSFRVHFGRLVLLIALIGTLTLLPFFLVATSAQGLPTNTPRPTQVSTRPPLATNTKAVTPTSDLPTLTPSNTLKPSRTPIPSNTPTFTHTPRPTSTPLPTLVIEGTYQTPVNTPVTMIPPSLPTPVSSGDDIVTILLLGSDTITPGATARTDVIILLAIDRTAQSVSMMHIPRDLFVYVPNYTMAKINTVVSYGNQTYGKGEGIKLMKETLLYNLGVKVDFYARVDFVTFQEIVTKLGGLQITVDCGIQDWKLKSPELDYNDPASWEPYTLNIGKHVLDGYTALWYVRSRVTSDDLDRGRRQIEVLKAMWRQARDNGLFAQVASLWPDAEKLVDTDMTLPDILGLVPSALAINPDKIQRINLSQGTHFDSWYTADTGSFVFLPKLDAWQIAVQNFMLPPSTNRLGGESPTVEVGAAPSMDNFDEVVADRLSWEGFNVSMLPPDTIARRDYTVLYDYTGGSYPNSLHALMKALRISEASVISKPDPNRTSDFRIEMGPDYGSSCFYGLPEDTPPTPEGS
ncbi:MAG: LCP family protein [Anaerolineae bacterium]|nr:LCP family protein [Anaerolineae bacterium]